jgi:hypothetical protein
MDREQEILNLIEEKKKLLEDTKNELYSLDFELHKIEKEKVLKKYKIGDIIMHRDKYLFRLDEIQVCGGHAASKRLIITDKNIIGRYDMCPQPICRLWTLLEFGRLANKKEIERFNETFPT